MTKPSKDELIDMVDSLATKVELLTEALKFVRTDPCFRHLGSVTHDKVTDALGLTNILWPLDVSG
jgi:hypothetical protein